MELEDFKSTWQSNLFITEVKEMTDIQKIIQQNTAAILRQIAKRYSRLINSTLIGTVLFVIFFYTISDGFRESPMGLIAGVVFMLAIAAFAWNRYQQLLALDYASSLKDRLQGLIAQRRRSLTIEQAFVIVGAVTILVVPRLFNGRGWPNLAQPDIAIGVVIAIAFLVTILFLIRRHYQRDIDALQALLTQLVGE